MGAASNVETRIRGYFDKYPDKRHTKQELLKHFNDVKPPTLDYHLRHLKDDQYILSPKQGVFIRNTNKMSDDEIRNHPRFKEAMNKVQPSEEPFNPLKVPITAGFSVKVVRMFSSSIIARMKMLTAHFTSEEIEFVENTFSTHWKLPENGNGVAPPVT